ncbi:MAG TPA: VTC domain-containing protein [Polyangia bacterium]|nr:VTC domain-containing protein [Polyangia bacterium]
MGGAVETNTPSDDPFDHEQRFLLSRSEMRRFLQTIAARAAIEIYDPARPISYTRTTYFDTNELDYFRSGDGSPARRLRVREYAVAANPTEAPVLSGVAFIELKEHEGSARRKVRLAATPAEIARLIDDRGGAPAEPPVADASPALATIARELALPTMTARLATWYRRLCLTGDARRVRITVDENLTFCRPQPIGKPGALAAPRSREVVAAFPARVLEIKHSGEMPVWLVPALESLQPARAFSKFQMGMTALGNDPLPHEPAPSPTDEEPPSPVFALRSFVAA